MAGEVVEGLVVSSAASPSPIYSAAKMIEGLKQYRELQAALDQAMPDQLIKLGDKMFRRKGYWRAVAVAFGLSVDPVTPEANERSVIGQLADGGENYVYTVTYRATTPTGRSMAGDGTCAASEKQRGRLEATEHNVRSHAHTRAFNRAVSNLCGFGEVSAEEVDREEHAHTPKSTEDLKTPVAAGPTGAVLVTDVKERSGTKNGKAWKAYDVTFSDGKSGATFDEKIAIEARAAITSKAPQVAVFEQKGKYTNLIELTPYKAPEPGLPLEDKEPVGGPEKILVIRQATPPPPSAPYGIIQTDKRQYVTREPAIVAFDKDGNATGSAAQLKASGKPVRVEFKPVGPAGKQVNQILEFGEYVAPVADPPAQEQPANAEETFA
jgi:hypothetical protein